MILGYKYFVPGTKYFVPGTPFPGKGNKYLAKCVQYFIPGHFYSFIVLDISFIVINISFIVINISFQVDNISFRESVSPPNWIRKPKFINTIHAHAQKKRNGNHFVTIPERAKGSLRTNRVGFEAFLEFQKSDLK